MDENFSTFSASLTSVPYQYQTIGRHCECDVEHTLALSVRTISRARTLRQNVDVRNGIFAILIRNGAVGLALACVRTYLYQCFHPRSYLLRVSPNKAPTFRVDLWQDNTIYAYLEDDITGAYDQENIQLVVNAGPTRPMSYVSSLKDHAAHKLSDEKCSRRAFACRKAQRRD